MLTPKENSRLRLELFYTWRQTIATTTTATTNQDFVTYQKGFLDFEIRFKKLLSHKFILVPFVIPTYVVNLRENWNKIYAVSIITCSHFIFIIVTIRA